MTLEELTAKLGDGWNRDPTAQDFYDYFAGIPDSQWTTNQFQGKAGCCCARGHLGIHSVKTHPHNHRLDDALHGLYVQLPDFAIGYNVAVINDGDAHAWPKSLGTKPRHPKARILKMLEALGARKPMNEEAA